MELRTTSSVIDQPTSVHVLVRVDIDFPLRSGVPAYMYVHLSPQRRFRRVILKRISFPKRLSIRRVLVVASVLSPYSDREPPNMS